VLELQANVWKAGDWLVDVDLDPDPPAKHKALDPNDPGALLTAHGRRNRVRVGVPQVVNVLDAWPKDKRLSQEINASRHSHRYLSVRLACSFLPDRGCRFTRVDYRVSLMTDQAEDHPLAVDLFPQNIGELRRYKRSYKLSANLTYAFVGASAEAGHEEDVIRYQPTIIADGLLGDEPSWSFRSGRAMQLEGIREMFMVVKAPAGHNVHAGFVVDAEVRTAFGLIPLRRYRQPELLTATYPLT
jgi:hypothetical protein